MTPENSSAAAVTAIAGTRRIVQLYSPSHPAYAEAVAELEAAVRAAAQAEPLIINLHQGRLYHGSLPVPQDVPGVAQLTEFFTGLGIESMVFQPTFSADDAVGFTDLLSLRPSPELDFASELAARGVRSVTVSLLARELDEEFLARDVTRDRDRGLLRRSTAATRTILEHVSGGDLACVAEARGIVTGILPRLFEDRDTLAAMAADRRSEDRPLAHAFNVMVYALLIGAEMGLAEESMHSLGTGALLHDIGKSAFSAVDASQQELLRTEHPRIGAEMLQHLAVDDPAPMVIAYEHHMYANGAGFPARSETYVTHPFSRIVSVADRFENLSAPTSEGGSSLTTDKALVQVLREANEYFDPLLVRLLARALGPFPVGSIVRLSDQSVGVVRRRTDDPLEPVVRLAFDDKGLQAESVDVELGDSALEIVEVISPEALDVDVVEFV